MADKIIEQGKFNPDYYKYRNGDDVFAIADWFGLDFPLGNALKYILRAGKKAGEKKTHDLQKAITCIQCEIELEAEKREQNSV